MELKRLKRVWKRVDSDGSGTLDHDEVKAIFIEMGKTLSQREFMRAMDQIDSDGSGEVDFKEFSLVLWNYLSFSLDTLAVFAFGLAGTQAIALGSLRCLSSYHVSLCAGRPWPNGTLVW